MSTMTENYNLVKPDADDYYDVQDFNENMDIIDTQLAQTELAAEEIVSEIRNISEDISEMSDDIFNVSTSVAAVSTAIGTSADSDSSTLFGKLNGIKFIKSIQTIILEANYNNKAFSTTIQTIDPDRCMVLTEKIVFIHDPEVGYNYELTANSISLTLPLIAGYSKTGKFRFQIIEFY